MAETPSVPFPVPNPPPPPLKDRVVLSGDQAGPVTSEPMNLPPSLALPTDDELRAEQSRQTMLQKALPTNTGTGESGGIVSVSRVAVPAPAEPAPVEPIPVEPIAVVPEKPVAAPVLAPAVNTGTATDVRPPVAPVTPAAPAPAPAPTSTNPLGQRMVRRTTPPTLAEQISRPTGLTQTPAALFPTTPTPAAASVLPTAPTKPAFDPNANMLAGLEADRPTKKRGPWLAIGVIGLVLLLGVGVALGLQSSGTIYSGFMQKIVGGFPKAADQALVLMRQKLPASYGVSGQVSLIKSSELPAIGGSEATQTTAEVSGTMQGSQQNGNWQVAFNWQLANDYPVTTLQGESLRLDTKRYVYLDTLSLLVSNNGWQEIAETDWTKTALSTPFSALELSAVLGRASGGEYLGRNELTVGGKSYSVNVYKYAVDQASEYQDATYKEGRLMVWIDRKTGQAVEYQLDELIKTTADDLVFQSVWEIDSAATMAEIALPSGEQATTGSISAIAMELGFVTSPTGTQDLATPKGRDAKRLADILSIKEGLLELYSKQGTYPVATAVDKTNDSRVLRAALVPTYLESLPVDPQNSKAYYGYTSDGFSFKLTSIVEDATSSGAKKGNGFYYQEVTN